MLSFKEHVARFAESGFHAQPAQADDLAVGDALGQVDLDLAIIGAKGCVSSRPRQYPPASLVREALISAPLLVSRLCTGSSRTRGHGGRAPCWNGLPPPTRLPDNASPKQLRENIFRATCLRQVRPGRDRVPRRRVRARRNRTPSKPS